MSKFEDEYENENEYEEEKEGRTRGQTNQGAGLISRFIVMKHRIKCYLCPDLTSSNSKPKTQNLFQNQWPSSRTIRGEREEEIGYRGFFRPASRSLDLLQIRLAAQA